MLSGIDLGGRDTTRMKKFNYIVKLTQRGGLGVLVGNVILTAAHCVNYSTEGEMVLGDYFIQEIDTWQGKIKATPIAVEPVRDIAVLGCLDAQEFPKKAEAFEQFCQSTTPVKLATRRLKAGQSFPVKIHQPNGTWSKGTGQIFGSDSEASICFEAEQEIKGGSSGGPILNMDGELVSIVSNFSIPNGKAKSTGSCPRPLYALPVWICRKFLAKNERQHKT